MKLSSGSAIVTAGSSARNSIATSTPPFVSFAAVTAGYANRLFGLRLWTIGAIVGAGAMWAGARENGTSDIAESATRELGSDVRKQWEN